MDWVLWLQIAVILIGIMNLIFIFWYMDEKDRRDKK